MPSSSATNPATDWNRLRSTLTWTDVFLVFPEEPLDTSLCARAAIQPQSWADVFRGLVALDLSHRQKGRETGRKIVEAYKDVLPLDNAALTQLVEASCQADAPTMTAVWTPMLNTLGLKSYADHLRSEMQRTGHPGLSELDNVKAIRLHHERVQARIGIEQAAEPERRSKWIEYTTKYGIEPNDFEAFYNALKADPAYLGTALPIMLRTRHRVKKRNHVAQVFGIRETIRLALIVQIQQHQDANLEPEYAIEMLPASPIWRTLFAGMWALQKHKHRLCDPLEGATPYKTMLDQCRVGRDEFLKVWSTFEGPHRMKSILIPSPSWQGSMAQCVAVYGWSLRDYVFDSSVPSLSDLCPSTWAYFEASRSLNVPPTAQDMALLCSTPEPSGLSSYGLPENTLEPI